MWAVEQNMMTMGDLFAHNSEGVRTRGVSDDSIWATCPKCEVRFALSDTAQLVTPMMRTYSCPTDGYLFARMTLPARGGIIDLVHLVPHEIDPMNWEKE